MASDPQLRRFATLIDGLRRDVRALQVAPRAPFTSLEVNGESVTLPEAVGRASDALQQAGEVSQAIVRAREEIAREMADLHANLSGMATDLASARSRLDAAQQQIESAITIGQGAAAQAGAAVVAAGQAQEAAANVTRIYHSLDAPSGSAPQGSTWFRHAKVGESTTNLSGPVIGQWTQTDSGIGSTWTASQVASEVIANLDLGKLTVGSATIVQAVAQSIASATGQFIELDVGNLRVTDAAKLQTAVADAIWARKIASQKILASEVLIGQGPNMIPWNPEGGAAPHTSQNGTTVKNVNDGDLGWCIEVTGGSGTDGTWSSFLFLRSATINRNGYNYFPVDPGSSYRFRVGIGAGGNFPSGVTREARAILSFYDASGAQVGSNTYSSTVTINQFGASIPYSEAMVTAPAGAVCLRIILQKTVWSGGTVFVADPSLTLATDGSLIVDGSIDGKVITGAVLQSSTNALGSGTGLRITGNALYSWQSGSRVTIENGAIGITISGRSMRVEGGRFAAQQLNSSGSVTDEAEMLPNGLNVVRSGRVFGTADAVGVALQGYRSDGTTGSGWIVCDFDSTGDRVRSSTVYGRTTTTAANVNVASNGTLARSTSLRAAKLEIDDAPESWADAVLALRPRTWLDKGNVERYADALSREFEGEDVTWSAEDIERIDMRVPGFVAEEVAEAGLTEFLTRDDQGNLTGLAYDRMPAALVALAQRQQKQIDNLTEQVATLIKESA